MNSLPFRSLPSIGLEIQLVLTLARTRVGGLHDDHARTQLRGGVNWTALRHVARRLEVGPLLWSHLTSRYRALVPPSVLEELRRERTSYQLHNHTRLIVVREILKRMAERGIACIPLKGPLLALQAYGDVSLRGFGDLDLLVRKGDLARARDVLLEQGFGSAYPPEVENHYIRQQYALGFARGRIRLELHGALLPRVYAFPLDAGDQLFSRAETIEVDGQQVSTLSKVDMLLYLCAHGAKHGWSSLRWICDVSEIAERMGSTHWERVLLLAREHRCERILLLALHLANGLLGTTLPATVLERVREDTTLEGMARARATDLLFPPPARSPRSGVERMLADPRVRSVHHWLPMRERLRDRLLYVARVVFVPTDRDHSQVMLPRGLAPLRYGIRPLRLLFRVATLAQ